MGSIESLLWWERPTTCLTLRHNCSMRSLLKNLLMERERGEVAESGAGQRLRVGPGASRCD